MERTKSTALETRKHAWKWNSSCFWSIFYNWGSDRPRQFAGPFVNRLKRAHDEDVIENTKMTQEPFRKHLSTNEVGRDALNRYYTRWAEDAEIATHRNVPTDSDPKLNTTEILPVKHDVRGLTTPRPVRITETTCLEMSAECRRSQMYISMFHYYSLTFLVWSKNCLRIYNAGENQKHLAQDEREQVSVRGGENYKQNCESIRTYRSTKY